MKTFEDILNESTTKQAWIDANSRGYLTTQFVFLTDTHKFKLSYEYTKTYYLEVYEKETGFWNKLFCSEPSYSRVARMAIPYHDFAPNLDLAEEVVMDRQNKAKQSKIDYNMQFLRSTK